ncbi:unnamed protein product, partial [Porites evermanni]
QTLNNFRQIRHFNPIRLQGSYKSLRQLFKVFSRTTFDYQRPPMRNLISEIVKKKCTFPVHRNRTLRLELFVPPTSLNVSVVARFSIFAFFVRMAIFSNFALRLLISHLNF